MSRNSLVVHARLLWVKVGTGRPICLRRARTARHVLRLLVRQHRADPRVGIEPLSIAEALWPELADDPHRATERVYSAVRRLRALGLRGTIERGHTGYLLSPHLSLAVARDP